MIFDENKMWRTYFLCFLHLFVSPQSLDLKKTTRPKRIAAKKPTNQTLKKPPTNSDQKKWSKRKKTGRLLLSACNLLKNIDRLKTSGLFLAYSCTQLGTFILKGYSQEFILVSIFKPKTMTPYLLSV